MNAAIAPHHYRSEAFAEDLDGLVPRLEVVPAPAPSARRKIHALLLTALPLALALTGAAVTVAMPLA